MTQFARTKLSDHLVLHVCRQVLRGELAPGDTLPSEQDLASSFGISKPVIRESLRALASLGLIHVQQGKRTVVQEPAEWNVLDPLLQEAYELEGRGDALAHQLYELRLILETASATRAAARGTEHEVERISALAAELLAIAESTRDPEEFLHVDRAFHDAIARASGNEVLRQMIRNVHGYLTRAWSRTTVADDEIELLAALHTDIADAIRARDEVRAGEAMSAHLGRALAKELARHASSQGVR